MAKKLLFAFVLILTLVCVFASCNDNKSDTPSTPESPVHTHAFGKWKTIQSATCTTDGLQERYCSCGESETNTIAGGHAWESCNCTACGETQLKMFFLDETSGYAVVGDGDYAGEIVVIPSEYKGYPVTQIGPDAFYNSNLKNITIPSSITSIGSSAFTACYNLSTITIPSSVTHIGGYAFDSCKYLTSITLSSSLTEISECMFRGCTYLAQINIPESVSKIGSHAFLSTALQAVTIPSSVTHIGAYAFSGCSRLTSITFKSTSGWKRGYNQYSVSSTALADPATAATYFTDTYKIYAFTRY